MGALSAFIWFITFIVGGVAVLLIIGLVMRNRYLNSGQEEGE